MISKFTRNEDNALFAKGFRVGRCVAAKHLNDGSMIKISRVANGYTRQFIETSGKAQPFVRFISLSLALNE